MLRLAFISSLLLAVADAQHKAIFVRWGHRSCPDGSQLIYSGMAAGSEHNQIGGGPNDLCLHNHPEFPEEAKRRNLDGDSSRITGTEYKKRNDDRDPANDQSAQRTQNQDAACAVCQTNKPGSTYVQWGRSQSCSNGHEKMYSGFTMANRRNYNGKGEFVCVDFEKQYHYGSIEWDQESHDWYMVETKQGIDENIYPRGAEVPCIVCLAPKATFVRWGKKECGDTAETLYRGLAASEARYERGSGYNALCLHTKPELAPTRSQETWDGGNIGSIEYNSWNNDRNNQDKANLVPKDSRRKDASCAVCMAKEEGEVYVQWGRSNSCSNSHKTMYNGLIMSSHWADDWKGEYVCVDPAMEVHTHDGPQRDHDEWRTHRWYTTDARESSLDTQKYKKDMDIGCSVCLAPKKNVFVAWGKSDCPDKSTQSLLYSGQVGASGWNDRGSGGNSICLHDLPQSAKNANRQEHHAQSRLYGMEYWWHGNDKYRKNYQKDASCAVCSTKQVGTTYVQWGRQTCQANYKEGAVNHTVVYKGMIHSTRYNWQGRSTYECVHMDRDFLKGNRPENSAGNRWYTTEIRTGSIQDVHSWRKDGYQYGYEIACVVCQGEAADTPPPTPAPTKLSTDVEFKALVANFNKLQKQVDDLSAKSKQDKEDLDEDIQTVIQTLNAKNNDRVNDISTLENTIIQGVMSGHNVSGTEVPERTSPNSNARDFEPTIEVDQGEVKISIAPGNRLQVNDGGEDDEIYTAKEVNLLVQEHVRRAFKQMYDNINGE